MSFRTTISWLLLPLSMWYAVGVAVRNMLYSMGFLRQEAPHITTIGIGNLSTGGTGKTPHVEYLLRLLADKYPTAMLSRGYKRKTKGFVLDDGSHNPATLGDEPAMIASKFPGVQVAVCEKRTEGVLQLMNCDQKPSLIILDDVFQHRSIKPSFNILLTEFRRPFYKDKILPYGDLREFKSGRYRANIVIVTKSPAVLNPVDRHNITSDLKLLNYQKVFFSYLKYGAVQTLDGHDAQLDLHRIDHVLAVTGIAHPEPMIEELKRHCKVHHLRYADHYNYTVRDVTVMKKTLDSLAGERKIILTTEKDAMRLRGLCDGLPVYVLPIEVAFHPSTDADFDNLIESTVKENISFLSKLSIWN